MTILEIDFAVDDIIVMPTGKNELFCVTASPRDSKENLYRQHIKRNRKRMYSAFVELVREHGAGMCSMLDQGGADRTDCLYVPRADCEKVIKDTFTKGTGILLWESAKLAIEQFHWPDKVPVLALSILDDVPSFFFVQDFSEPKKQKKKGFGVL